MARARSGRDPSGDDAALAATRDALATVFREEAGRLTASVMRVLRDFDAAEEVVQDALLAAWRQWSVDGIPQQPAAWLWTVAPASGRRASSRCALPAEAGRGCVAGRTGEG